VSLVTFLNLFLEVLPVTFQFGSISSFESLNLETLGFEVVLEHALLVNWTRAAENGVALKS